MSDIRLIVSDVDGTLVQLQKHEVSDKVRNAVIAAEKAGVKVVPVTGRPYEYAKPVMTVLGFDSLCVVDNGASIRDAKTGELVWSKWLDVATVRQLVELVLPWSIGIDYSPEYNEHVPDSATEMALVTSDAPYVYAAFPVAKLAEMEAGLQKIRGIAYHVDAFTDKDEWATFQVTHKEATKFYGVETLRNIVGVAKKHTMAIGDGNNDLPLFQNAGLKVAMGNAVPALKDIADEVVATISEDGFAEAVNKFVLH